MKYGGKSNAKYLVRFKSGGKNNVGEGSRKIQYEQDFSKEDDVIERSLKKAIERLVPLSMVEVKVIKLALTI